LAVSKLNPPIGGDVEVTVELENTELNRLQIPQMLTHFKRKKNYF
jgi:hypothetical protein